MTTPEMQEKIDNDPTLYPGLEGFDEYTDAGYHPWVDGFDALCADIETHGPESADEAFRDIGIYVCRECHEAFSSGEVKVPEDLTETEYCGLSVQQITDGLEGLPTQFETRIRVYVKPFTEGAQVAAATLALKEAA